jgi:type III restriction enzyme
MGAGSWLKTTPAINLILETKGFDDLADVKAAAAERWVSAVNAGGAFGNWRYAMARKIAQVREILDAS